MRKCTVRKDKLHCKSCNKDLYRTCFGLSSPKDLERKKRNSICKKCMPKKMRIFRTTIVGKYNQYRSSAKRRKLQFSITLEDFRKIINGICYYCGLEDKKLGVDRFDNSLGYTIENCVSCCWTCNKMKGTMDINDFLSIIKKIYQRQSLTIDIAPHILAPERVPIKARVIA